MRWINDWVTLSIFVISIGLTFFAANDIYNREVENTLLHLETDVEKYAANIVSETERSLTLLSTLKGFLSVSNIQRDTFYAIADDAMQRYEQLQGIAWVPYVPHENREKHESSQRKF